MGNSKSRKKKEPKNLFERIHKEEAEKKRQAAEAINRLSGGDATNNRTNVGVPPPRPARTDPQPPIIPYDKEAIDRMRHQMKHNPGAFILNNILLSVQFLDNYERVLSYLKNDSITETDRELSDNMAQHQKHVFFPDKLQEIIDAHIYYYDRSAPRDSGENSKTFAPRDTISRKMEPLQHQRMYIIHDNIEVNQPGEISDYSTITNAPHYNFVVESSEEPGFVKLKRMDTNKNMSASMSYEDKMQKPDNIESGAESDISDISKDEEESEGLNFLNDLKNRVNQPPKPAFKENGYDINSNKIINKSPLNEVATNERRPSGILKSPSRAVVRATLPTNRPKTKRPRPQDNDEKKSVSESESSGYKSSHSPQTESDYGYATITAESSLKRLEMSQLLKTSDNTSEIPPRCISVIEVKKLYSDDDEDTDEAYESRYGDFQRELYKKLHYLNSKMFMLNFADLFQLKLAQSLGFNNHTLVNAMTQGASIYCENINNRQVNSYEVIPAVSLTWPREAGEWSVRLRNTITNPRTNFVYQWPTRDMVDKSRGLGCCAVPMGFVPTRGTNPQQAVQWRLTFPTVERYLETCMAHSQVRCYIFSLILFKKFIEIKGSNIGFSAMHIKNHLFWQMEDNYARWPEDRLGEALLIFLKSFYEHLMKSKLPYYFIPKSNLAKGIPKSILLRQQKKLADILESPVMHILSALRNVKYTKPDFYPTLNYKKLYTIITCDDPLRLINPHIPVEIGGGSDEEDAGKVVKSTEEGFWVEAKKKNPEYHWKKEQLRHRQAIKAAQEIVTAQGTPKELIELKKKIPPLDMHRKRLILETFIPHFISIADYSLKFESLRQSLLYLEHARRLSTLLKEEPGGEGKGREYVAIINEKIEHLKTVMVKPSAPKLPTRNESSINLPGPSGIRPKLTEYVNVTPANQKEHFGNYRHGSESPTTRMANVVFADVHIESETKQPSSRPKPIRAVSFNEIVELKESDEDGVEESKL